MTQGTLYLCATPIGNLEDITLRVLRCLKEADVIACEDTRTSSHLLSHYDIHGELVSYHKFNEETRSGELVARMLGGESVALITDAGMPAISDPGETLVRAAMEAGITVTALPGASAVVTALALSGQATRRFVFEGFLPADKKEREEVLASLARETRTMVLYEAPHRLAKTLEALQGVLGEDRSITLCRELTKKFETITKTTIGEALARASAGEVRGEFVLVIAGWSLSEAAAEKQEKWMLMTPADHVAYYEAQGYPRKEAMRLAARDRGVSRRDIYRDMLDVSQEES